MASKPGTKLGIGALLLALGCFLAWFRLNRLSGIPADRTLFVLVFLAAVGLGVAAFVRGTTWYGGLGALGGIFIGALIPFTVYVSPQQLGEEAIGVGDTIPHFRAQDEFGEWFDSDALQGHLVLIKFFRAHW